VHVLLIDARKICTWCFSSSRGVGTDSYPIPSSLLRGGGRTDLPGAPAMSQPGVLARRLGLPRLEVIGVEQDAVIPDW